MNRVNELFGKYTNGDTFPDLTQALIEQKCPWASNDGSCFKTRKNDTHTSIGTCSLCFDHSSQPLIVCPNRLKDRNRIFNDCIQFIASSITGNELYLIPEVSTSVGYIDYMLVTANDSRAIDFVALELQTLDTTGSIWGFRQSMLKENGYVVDDSLCKYGVVGINWKMTAKTILAQLVQKSELFAGMGKNIVLICQTPLYKYMEENFNFSNVSSMADMRDVLHFHIYDYSAADNRMELRLAHTRSASLSTVKQMLGMNKEANQECSALLDKLSSQLKKDYLFQPFS